MVDPKTRHQLSGDVRRLVTGRMTTDEFDDAYYDCYCRSDDLAIREIARFCWGLYSSDLGFSHCLRGCHAVPAETRRTACRAVLFLRTDRKYEYPETPDSLGHDLVGCAWYNGGLVGIAFLVMAVMSLFAGVFDVAGICLAVGLLILFVCTGSRLLQYASSEPERRDFENAGDPALWPFASAESIASANDSSHLLGRSER